MTFPRSAALLLAAFLGAAPAATAQERPSPFAGMVPVTTTREWITAAAFAPDGKTLAASVQVGDAAGPTALLSLPGLDHALREFTDFPDHTAMLSFSADGSLLAAGGRMGWVAVWEVSSGRLMQKFFPQSAIVDLQAHFGPADPHTVYVEASWLAGQLVDWTTGKIALRSAQRQGSLWVSLSQNRTVVAHPDDGQLAIDRLPDGKRVKIMPETNVPVELHDVTLSADGARVAAIQGRRLFIFDTASGKRLLDLDVGARVASCMLCTPDLAFAAVSAGAYAREGEKLAVWDLVAGKPVQTLATGCRTIQGMELSADGRRIFVHGYAGAALLEKVD